MRPATYLAFFDELEKMGSDSVKDDLLRALLGKPGVFLLAHQDQKKKQAGLIQNLGTRIVSGVRAAPKVVADAVRATPGAVQGGIQNAGKAVGAFATPLQSAKAGWKMSVTDFKQMKPWMKGLMGLGLVSSAVEVGSKNDPMGQGRSRLNRGITAAGDQVGGLIGTPFGLAGGLVGGQIGRKAGGLVGKGVDRLRGYQAQQPSPPPPAGV